MRPQPAFFRRYHRDGRDVDAWGRWLVWDGHRWRAADTPPPPT